MKIVVVGGTGLIGRRLAAALGADGEEVVAVARTPGESVEGARYERWDPAEGPLHPDVLQEADAVVNLAGAPLQGGRWSESRKRLLWDSRVGTTQRLVDSLRGAGVRTLVSGSAVGYYGPAEEARTEESPAGDDFLADLASAWEAAAEQAGPTTGARVVLLRTGVVLASEGGALPVMARPIKLFVGGPLGSGRQWVPWVHVDDVVGIIRHAIDNGRVSGPINAVSPAPVRQGELASAIGDVLGRPTVLPTPAFVLRMAMGEMSSIALEGQPVVPERAQASGYRFVYPDLEPALQAELGG